MPGLAKIVAPGVTDKTAEKAALAPLDELLAAVPRAHHRLAAVLAAHPTDPLSSPS